MICPSCGKRIPDGAPLCPECGKDTQFSARFFYEPDESPLSGRSAADAEQAKDPEPAAGAEALPAPSPAPAPTPTPKPKSAPKPKGTGGASLPPEGAEALSANLNKCVKGLAGTHKAMEETRKKWAREQRLSLLLHGALATVFVLLILVITLLGNGKRSREADGALARLDQSVDRLEQLAQAEEEAPTPTPTPAPTPTPRASSVVLEWNLPAEIDPDGNAGTLRPVRPAEGDALPVPPFCPAGYAFAGWNTRADGSGASWQAGELLIPDGTEPERLYAQWLAETPAETAAEPAAPDDNI